MFLPNRIIFQKDTQNHPIAKEILSTFKDNPKVEIINVTSNQVKKHIPGEDLCARYKEGKKTLVVGIKTGLKFQSCKPSAHYQLPLVSGCMGQCEYCYLNTNMGDKSFIKIFVNIEDIFNQADKYIKERLPEITIFEGAATSDPIPVEPYTHSLEKAITYFGENDNARFRFVTKYNDVDSLINLKHNNHTEVRFSINTATIINEYEHFTASVDKRIEASKKMAEAGYPIGFIVAPVFVYPNWKEEYHDLLVQLNKKLPKDLKFPVTFEIISHRYTTAAKNIILQVFPETNLPMVNEERKYKYGQFGYGKYVYPKESMEEIKEFFIKEIETLFKNKEVKYII
jgi:spore photoproduct lyase